MHNTALRVAILVTGFLLLLGGAAALADPARLAAALGVAASSPLGAASLRADLCGFFATAGIMTLAAGWRRAPALLTAPLLMMALALTGRCVALAFVPFTPALLPPMIAEAVMVVLFAAGRRA